MKRIVLIPAYMPDEKMADVARGMYDAGFDVVIVDDGSPEEYAGVFRTAALYAQVLCHDKNRGKGEALKTGLRYIRSQFEAPYTVVNADADGQHKVEDIIRVACAAERERRSLVLGSRKMEGDVPFKSRAGNGITRLVYRLSTGSSVYDTQTGLRAYSDLLVDRLLLVGGSRYEYEMNMLMELQREGYGIREVWISTVYLNGNQSSHFHPVKDSAKIYREILRFSAASLVSFGVDYGLFCLLSALTGALVFSNVLARTVSGTVNFTLNRKLVFRSKSNLAPSAVKYAALALAILLCNTLLLTALTGLGIPAYGAKILTEGTLFGFSYLIQHSLIFRKGGKKPMRQHRFAVCAAALLIAFTTYISLDTFVLARSYDTNATEVNTSMFAALPDSSGTSNTTTSVTQGDDSQTQDTTTSKGRPGSKGRSKNRSASMSDSASSAESGVDASAAYTGENTVTTDNYTITLREYYQNNTKIYVADVTLRSAQYLKTAFANDTYGKNVTATTSSIAQSNNAILAINGDYYGVQESGYVIRNGVVYRSTPKGCDVLCICADGTMEIVSDSDYTADELVAKGVWQAFTFGPALVEDSSVTVGVNTEVGKAMASNPRTAIGLIDANHFVFVVSDGRTSESEGLSLYELATFMQSLGVKTAYNLDGGGSSTMYFNGAVVNNPTTNGKIRERGVSDIVYI